MALAETEVDEKIKQLKTFKERLTEIKARYEDETKVTMSQEKLTRRAEERLKDREKELKVKEQLTQALKQQMFRDSQKVAQLRQQEAKFITDIRSTQVRAINNYDKLQVLGKIMSTSLNAISDSIFSIGNG